MTKNQSFNCSPTQLLQISRVGRRPGAPRVPLQGEIWTIPSGGRRTNGSRETDGGKPPLALEGRQSEGRQMVAGCTSYIEERIKQGQEKGRGREQGCSQGTKPAPRKGCGCLLLCLRSAKAGDSSCTASVRLDSSEFSSEPATRPLPPASASVPPVPSFFHLVLHAAGFPDTVNILSPEFVSFL